jgi:signal peptidase I
MSTFIRESSKYKPYELQHRFRKRIFFLLKFLLIVFALYLIIHNFFISSFIIENSSMEPTLRKQERIFATPFLYGPYYPFSIERIFTISPPERGDIVVFIPSASRPSKVLYKAVDPIVRFFTLGRVYSVSKQLREHRPRYLIKRIIGVPGDTVELRENGVHVKSAESEFFLHEMEVIDLFYKVTESNELYTSSLLQRSYRLEEEEYFILGDNRTNSIDSLNFGPVKADYIYGKVIFRYWPFKRFGKP